MAENKKSVLIYTDWIDKFEALTDEEAGKLIKHFFRYVNDMNPEAPDRTTQLMFIDIRNTLKRDLKKYEGVKKKLSNSGKLGNLKRYNLDLYNKVINDEITLNEAEAIATQRKNSQGDEDNREANKNVAKLAVSDSDSVSDSVSDISIYTEKDFLEDWAKCRKAFLNVPTHIPKLKVFDIPKFNNIVKDYSKEQIRESMRGLFMQEVIKFSSMKTQPSHFLENVDKYYNAFISNDKKLYGSKPVQQ